MTFSGTVDSQDVALYGRVYSTDFEILYDEPERALRLCAYAPIYDLRYEESSTEHDFLIQASGCPSTDSYVRMPDSSS